MATRTVPSDRSSPVLRLTPRLYRRLHALAKREAGAALNVQSFKQLQAFGHFSCMAQCVIKNAAAPCDVRQSDEAACITLASRINVAKLRATTRPEIDWGAIPADRLYEFIFWHEVGHRVDNLDPLDFMTSEYRHRPDFARWRFYFTRVNEVLADRYAWNKLFPGQPLPIARRHSAEHLQEIADHIEQFSECFQRGRHKPRPLPEGQAEYIPRLMLESPSLARLTGLPGYGGSPVSESNDADAWRASFAASRTGPQRPILETTDGNGITYVQRDGPAETEPRAYLCIGRDCELREAVSEASRYGFRPGEIASFLAGARATGPL